MHKLSKSLDPDELQRSFKTFFDQIFSQRKNLDFKWTFWYPNELSNPNKVSISAAIMVTDLNAKLINSNLAVLPFWNSPVDLS